MFLVAVSLPVRATATATAVIDEVATGVYGAVADICGAVACIATAFLGVATAGIVLGLNTLQITVPFLGDHMFAIKVEHEIKIKMEIVYARMSKTIVVGNVEHATFEIRPSRHPLIGSERRLAEPATTNTGDISLQVVFIVAHPVIFTLQRKCGRAAVYESKFAWKKIVAARRARHPLA